MKKLIFACSMFLLAGGLFAQDAPKTTAKPADTKKTETKMAEHKCTSACKDGKHMYAHGEKGHTCTAACKK